MITQACARRGYAVSDLVTFGGRLFVLGLPLTTRRLWLWRVSAGEFHGRMEEVGLSGLRGTQVDESQIPGAGHVGSKPYVWGLGERGVR